MDLLLTHGYFIEEDEHEKKIMKPYPPLGILYISSYLKSKNVNVEIFDSTFSTLDNFKNYIQTNTPKYVGIYCNLMTKFNVLKMITICKKHKCIIILGGPEPVNYAEEYLSFGAHIIVVGEGEETIEELLKIDINNHNEINSVNGIKYLENEKVITTHSRKLVDNLSSHPWPDRTGIDYQRYLDTWKQYHNESSVSLITSRGCPYTCTWCSHSVFGKTHRKRNVEEVVDEIEWIKNTYNPDQLWFADDVLTIHTSWFLALAHEIDKRNVAIPFECISRADRLNDDVIDALSKIKCSRLWIGAESGSQRVLDKMKRKTNVDDIRLKTKKLQSKGIHVGMFIMLGYEDENIRDIKNSIKHLKLSMPDIFLTTVAYPIKGTEYYKNIENYISTQSDWQSTNDRDLDISGRYSDEFYKGADMWMVSSVNCSRNIKSKNYLLALKNFINANRGKSKLYWEYFKSLVTNKSSSGTGWQTKDRIEKAW